MAQIELRAHVVATLDGTISPYHSYVLVTYDDGSQYYLRGGSTGGGRGDLIGEFGEYTPDSVDWDDEGDDLSSGPLATGSDAAIAALHQGMLARAEAINAASHQYDVFVTDSNAFAGALIEVLGIDKDAAVPMGPDGNTIFLTAYYNPVPYRTDLPVFAVALDDYLIWVEQNGIDNEIGQMLVFAEAWLRTLEITPKLAEESVGQLQNWLADNFGIAATLGSNAADALEGSGAGELVAGLKGDDTLKALGGDDHLDGGSGADRMEGGAGDDFYRVEDAGDRVVETSKSGADAVESSVSFSISGQSVEKVVLTGSADIDATGNFGANDLAGNGGENRLLGHAGADRLKGGGGADVFVFSDHDGRDRVRDFHDGTDLIDLTAVDDVENFGDLRLTDTGPGVRVDYGTGSFVLADVPKLTTIDAGDFLFA
jgi:Ca2+-binding RTX toxin-like protein